MHQTAVRSRGRFDRQAARLPIRHAPGLVRPTTTLNSSDVLALQRSAGNEAVQRLVSGALRIGSRGPEVAQLQQDLNASGAMLQADGAFGPRTRTAVVAFQKAAGLAADGIVGPKTRAAIATGGVSIPGAGAASSELQAVLVAKLSLLKAKLHQRRTDNGENTPAPPAPAVRHGWLDDVVETVGETVDSVSDAVGGAVDAATETVGGVVDAVTGTVTEAVGGVVDTVNEAVGGAMDAVTETVGGAMDAVGGAVDAVTETLSGGADEAAEAVTELLTSVSTEISEIAADLREELGPVVDEVLVALGGAGGGGVRDLASLISAVDRMLAHIGTPGAEELGGGAAASSFSFTKTKVKVDSLQFDDRDFAALHARMTAKHDANEHIGQAVCTPTLLLNGKVDGGDEPDEAKVRSASLKVTEEIGLPTWTNVDAAAVQDDQRAEWNAYVGRVEAHENGHAADDEAVFSELWKVLAKVRGKGDVGAARQLLTKAVEESNTKAVAFDAGNPIQGLRWAGKQVVRP